MSNAWSALLVFALLLASAGASLFVQRFLTDAHRSRESRELSQAVTGMLVTFAALVLGLLISSVQHSFDQAGGRVRAYSVTLIELGQTLRDIGPDADPARGLLRSYVAQAIASTWPGEAAPAAGTAASPPTMEGVALGALLDRVEREIRRLPANESPAVLLAAIAAKRLERVVQSRWDLIESARNSIPVPFYRVLVFWLMLVFASLGLIAPRNALTPALIGLAAVAIASVVFTAMELDGPFGGLLAVSSEPMRDALAHLSR